MSGRKRGKQKRAKQEGQTSARAASVTPVASDAGSSRSRLHAEPPAVAQAAPVSAGAVDGDAGAADDSWSELERDFFERGDELHGPAAVAAASGSGGRAS